MRSVSCAGARTGQLDELLVGLPTAHPVGERLPLGIEERIPVLSSAVVEVATALGQQWVQEEFARSDVVGNRARLDNPEVHSGLFLVPGGGARRECLQAHGR